MIDRLIAALREAQLDLDWRDLADVLWLADVRTRVAAEQEGLPDSDAAIAGQSATDRLGIAQPASPAAAPEVRDAPPTVSAEKARPALAEGVTPLSPARWQLTRQGGAEDSGGLGLDAVAAARYALPGGEEIGRALRPLKQRRRTPRLRVFDPESTVDLFCDTGVLAPVLRPGLERWFDVAVVADIAATMAVWDDTVAAFADLLERHGAFRAVSRWGLRERDGEIEMLTPSGLAHRPHELLDLAGRRLILVVTDAVDELWARTPVWQAVREWGEYGPVALVQLLPPRSWVQTRVGEADAAVMATRPGQPNQQLDVVPPWWWLEREPPEHVVPVVGLDEASLAPWARMVMGAVGVSVPGVVPVPDSLTDAVALEACAAEGGGALGIVPADAGETHGEVDLDRLGNVLRSTVSAQAYRLAVLLSAVEVSLPIARIVMHQLMPQARLAHLAELIAAGVLRAERVPAGSAAHGAGTQVSAPGGTGRPMVALTFAPDLRNLLQRSLTVTMTLQVWRAVGPYLEATQGMPRFSLLLESADLITEPGSVTETVPEGMQTIASDLAIRLGLKPAPTVAEARPADPSAPEVGPPTVWTVDSVVKSVAAVPLPEGRTLLASGGADTTIRLWDPVTGTPLGEPLTGHTGAVNAVAAAELDGRPVVISGSNDATVRVWDPVIAGRVQKALPITPLPPDIFRLLAAAPAPLSPYLKVLAFERLVEERTRNFVGRDYIFRGIDDLLEDPAFPSGYILIRGEPGIGKTALLSQLVKSRGYVHHFNIAPEGIRSTRVFLENVCAQLIVRYKLDYATLPPEASQDSAFLAQLLTEAAGKTADQRVVVLVDALDDAEDIGLPATANRLYLPAVLPQKVFTIVTSREQIDYRLDVNRRQDLYLRDDDPQNLNDVRAYVRSFLHANQEDMTALVGTWKIDPEDFVELLTDKSQGNFMYLVYVLADIRAGKLSPQTVDNIQDLPQGLRSYYQRHWRAMRAEDQDRFERIHEPVLRILAAVREPVTLSAIQEWTNIEPPRIREVIRDWRPFLKEESSENGEPSYRFYHVSFQDFLAEEGVGLKPYHQQTGQQETSNELRRIWQGVAEQGYSLTTDWDIGLPLRFRKDFRELYYDRGQLRNAKGFRRLTGCG